MPAISNAQRVQFLDGLRGVAIALVVLYHAYARWAEMMPFGGKFSKVWLLANGWLGVQLFFLISGFVIFMTLERSRGFGNFCFKRWLRLFPAMLACSLLILITAPILWERPGGIPNISQLLPGLTFIDEDFFVYLGWPIGAIEGAFWSLFVEVKLYLVAGLVYFRKGRGWAIAVLLAIFGIWLASAALASAFPTLPESRLWSKAVVIIELSSARYFGWFVAGALLHTYFSANTPRHLLAGLVVATIAAATTKGTNAPAIAMSLALIALFAAALICTPVQMFLANRVLVFLGFVSYPLYLFHEGVIVALTIKLGRAHLSIPDVLLPMLPIAVVIATAWLVATYVEPMLRHIIVVGLNGWTRGAVLAPHRRH